MAFTGPVPSSKAQGSDWTIKLVGMFDRIPPEALARFGNAIRPPNFFQPVDSPARSGDDLDPLKSVHP